MALTLPNLDDRRWSDFVDEGRALIPVYAPDWTDHNVHDPGITLMELFAWIAESDIYRLNRIPDRRRLKFLALLGIAPHAPRGARVVLGLRYAQNVPPAPIHLPAGVEFKAEDPFGTIVHFRTLSDLDVIAASLRSIQATSAQGQFTDWTSARQRGEAIQAFGPDPRPGAALYLGFDRPLPPGTPATLLLEIENGGGQQRHRLIRMLQTAAQACRTPDSLLHCDDTGRMNGAPQTLASTEPILEHHSVRTVWEAFLQPGGWQRLEADAVLDETRAFTLNGRVVIHPPATMKSLQVGESEEELYYLRCRLLSGSFDAAPGLRALTVNGAQCLQEIPAGPSVWTIVPDAVIQGPAPQPGQSVNLRPQFDDLGRIAALDFQLGDTPQYRVLDYQPPAAGQSGGLSLQAVEAGIGNGKPVQEIELEAAPVAGENFQLASLEEDGWRLWERRPDFDASGAGEAHFLLDPQQGRLLFGDGDSGRVVPRGAPLLAVYSTTQGESGNLEAGLAWRLADSPSNRALLPNWEQVKQRLGESVNPRPAAGGADAESLDEAVSRAFRLVEDTQRAVTLADFERLALETPGTRIARAQARANHHPAFPCFQAEGVVTVLVLPYLPAGRPAPSRGLLRAVAAHLSSRRVLGTRVEVAGPVYLEVTVKARVRACLGAAREQAGQRILQALKRFFHPLQGGPEGEGWPFGRDVYRSEVLQVIDESWGVDHVLELEFIVAGKPSCGNVCLPPQGLPASGAHEIEVVREES